VAGTVESSGKKEGNVKLPDVRLTYLLGFLWACRVVLVLEAGKGGSGVWEGVYDGDGRAAVRGIVFGFYMGGWLGRPRRQAFGFILYGGKSC